MRQQTLRNKDSAVVLAVGGSLADTVSNLDDDVLNRLTAPGSLLGDDGHVRVRLECTLESQV